MSLYYIKINEEGYVVDLTAVPTANEEYTLFDLKQPVAAEYTRGYYKVVDNMFVLDVAKKAEYDAAQEEE